MLTVLRLPFLLLLAALCLQGCAFQQWKVNDISRNLRHGSPQSALSAMESISPPKRDRAQHLLNLGMLKQLNGDYAGSIKDLEQAKQVMQQVNAISVSEVIGASTVNETLRSYKGSPAELVMLNQVQAVNYLALGKLDEARVEMLQADVTMREPAHKDSLSGQLASVRFMAGVIFELGREWSDAMIAYRKSYKIMQSRNQSVPKALQLGLMRMSQKLGLSNEYRQYVKNFGYAPKALSKGDAEVVVLYWQGVVSVKQQEGVSVYAPSLNHHVSLALPAYPFRYPPQNETLVNVAGVSQNTQLLENIEDIAREDLNEVMDTITAAALVRVVAKHKAIKEAQQQGSSNNAQGVSLLGFFTDVVATLTEVADVRSWNTLPSSIQVARITVPAGQQAIRIGQHIGSQGQGAVHSSVRLPADGMALIIAHSISPNIQIYSAK